MSSLLTFRQTSDDSSGRNGERLWECGDACVERGQPEEVFIVEREVVQDHPEENTVDENPDERCTTHLQLLWLLLGQCHVPKSKQMYAAWYGLTELSTTAVLKIAFR